MQTIIVAVLRNHPEVQLVTTQAGLMQPQQCFEKAQALIVEKWYGESVPDDTISRNWVIGYSYHPVQG